MQRAWRATTGLHLPLLMLMVVMVTGVRASSLQTRRGVLRAEARLDSGFRGLLCPPGQYEGEEGGGTCLHCLGAGEACLLGAQCCHNMSCSSASPRCHCQPGEAFEHCSSSGWDEADGPVPTSVIIGVTCSGLVGFVCISLYTYRMTNVRRQSPEHVAPAGKLAPPQKQLEDASKGTKHVVEVLLRGAMLAPLDKLAAQTPQVALPKSRISSIPVQAESSI